MNVLRRRPWLLVVIGLLLCFAANAVFLTIAFTHPPVPYGPGG
ncbi:MAG: hypothetical protein AAF628_01975 [Planctomycetota bacterium]